MKHSSPAPLLRRLAAVALLFSAGLAQAQFVWVDPKGVRHYSDQPPPPGTPPARILKAPGLPAASAQAAPAPKPTPAPQFSVSTLDGPVAVPPAQAASPAATPGAARTAPTAPQTLAEKEADFRKRQKDSQEAEQKAQQQARTDAQKAEHCAEVRKAKQMYDSGIRIAEMGPDGKKRYLSDAERTERSTRAGAMAAECR